MARPPHTAQQHPTQPTAPADTQPRRFIKLAEVRTLTTLSTSEIYRRIAAGTFPTQITLGPKSVVWLESDVTTWINSRIAESRGEAA